MRKTRKSREVVVYSVQGHRLYGTSRSEAILEVQLGNARFIRSAAGAAEAIQLRQLNRADAQSPSGLPASTMHGFAGGARWAETKVKEWGKLQQQNFQRLIVAA